LTVLPRFQEILNLKRAIQTPVSYLYFEERLSLAEVRDLNRVLVFTDVASLVVDKMITTRPETFLHDSWSNPLQPEEEEAKVPLARLRLELRVETLTTNRILVAQVASIIEHAIKDKYDLFSPQQRYDLQVFASPQNRGAVDIYVN